MTVSTIPVSLIPEVIEDMRNRAIVNGLSPCALFMRGDLWRSLIQEWFSAVIPYGNVTKFSSPYPPTGAVKEDGTLGQWEGLSVFPMSADGVALSFTR